MRKKVLFAILALSVLALNGCRSAQKETIKPVSEPVAIVEEKPIVEIVKPVIVEKVDENDLDNDDLDNDGLPNEVDERPTQHLTETVAEVGSQKLVILDNIKLNSDKLSSQMLALLDNVADALSKDKNLKIRVVGHTCDLGTEAYNLKLSEKRAHAAHKYLLSKNVAKDRIIVEWKGESSPSVPNVSEENRSKNRRVEVIFY